MTPAEYAEWARGLRGAVGTGGVVHNFYPLSLSVCMCCGGPTAREGDAAIIEAAPKLADAVVDLAGQLATLTAERDRLARILAVERGDASAAPEGWRCTGTGEWHRPGARVIRCRRVYWWSLDSRGGFAEAPTALEAMEAADAALRGEP